MYFLDNNLYSISIIIGIICFISTYAVVILLFFPRKGLLAKKIPSLFQHLNNTQALQTQNMANALDPLLEEKIADLLKTITAQIPMGSMLLSGSLGKTLKGKTKVAVLEMLPELKEEALIKAETLLEASLEKQALRIIFKYGTLAALCSALIGILWWQVFVYIWSYLSQ